MSGHADAGRWHRRARNIAKLVLAIAAGLATFATLMAVCDTEPAPPTSSSPGQH